MAVGFVIASAAKQSRATAPSPALDCRAGSAGSQ